VSAPIVNLGRDFTQPVGIPYDPANTTQVHPYDLQYVMWAIGGAPPPPIVGLAAQGAVRSAAFYLGPKPENEEGTPVISEAGVGTFTELIPDGGAYRKVGTVAKPWHEVRANFLYGNGSSITGVTHPADLAAYQLLSAKGVANGYAALDSDGKVPAAQLPAIAITDTFVVVSEVAMLALDAETGDVAIRTDLTKSFILAGTDPTQLADWQEILAPNSVTSVFGSTGAITALTVGNGMSLGYSGTGTINASALGGATFAAPGAIGSTTPAAGNFTTLGATGRITASTDLLLNAAGLAVLLYGNPGYIDGFRSVMPGFASESSDAFAASAFFLTSGGLTSDVGFKRGGTNVARLTNGSTGAGILQFGSLSKISSPSDGVVALTDNAGTAFVGLQFGGVTSSFPMWKRSSAQLQARLADDSGFADIHGSYVAAKGGGFQSVNASDTSFYALLANNLQLNDVFQIKWSSDSTYYGTPDLYLDRAAANVLAVTSNGTTGGAAIELFEMTAPGNPGTGGARFYAIDNGGKTEVICKFDDGSTAQVCIQP
jgi:hypothetical protein